jgi:hypothetical protein
MRLFPDQFIQGVNTDWMCGTNSPVGPAVTVLSGAAVRLYFELEAGLP